MSSLSTSANFNQQSFFNDKKILTKDNSQDTSNRSVNLKLYEIKNIYNKLNYEQLKGIKRFENFPIFSVRESELKKKKKLIFKLKKNDFYSKKYNSYLSSKNSIYITQNSSLEALSLFPSLYNKMNTNNDGMKFKKIINYKSKYNNINDRNYQLKLEKKPIRNIFLNKIKYSFRKEESLKSNKSSNFLFNKKSYELNKYRTSENSPSKIISKLNDFLNNKIIYKFKKERVSRIQESKKNLLESVDDKISSLHNSQELLDNKYIIKYKKYISRIYKEMNIQDNIDKILCDKIIKLKQTIYRLNRKINKLLVEKNMYVKWMIFQIQIKEKIIKLPKQYKKLLRLENNEKIPENISKYKNEIIFSNPEELINKIKSLEDKNIKLMETFRMITKSLCPLKFELEKENEINQSNINIREIKELFILKEKEKTKNGILIDKINTLKNQLELYPINSMNKENSSKLYQKINFIFNNINEKEPKIKIPINEEKEIINMLTEIEVRYFKEREFIKYYEANEKEMFKIAKAKVIKHRIKEKVVSNKDILEEKKNLLNKRIIEKSNKLVLLPTIKINWNVYKIKKKVKSLININNNINKEEEEIENKFGFFNYE